MKNKAIKTFCVLLSLIFTVSVMLAVPVSAEFKLSEDNFTTDFDGTKILTGITVGTTVGQIKSEYASGSVTVTKPDGTDADDNSYVGTGFAFTVTGEKADSFKTVIFGDLTGDGIIASDDLLTLQTHLLGISQLAGSKLTACDVNHDMGVDSTDMLTMVNAVLGISSISQTLPDIMISNPSEVKILTIGDSLTQGVGARSGYRYKLYEKLYQAGANFSFVGPNKNVDSRLPAEYLNHAGYGGYFITGNADNQKGIKPLLKDTVMNREYDIILLMIGTNDCLSRYDMDNAGTRYRELLDELFTINSKAVVYAAAPPRCRNEKNEIIMNYGDTVNSVVAEYAAKGYDIQFVDMRESGITTSDISSDTVHLNESGYWKVAEMWYNAIADRVLQMNRVPDPDYVAPVRVTGVSMDKTEATVAAGEDKTIRASVTPSDADIFTLLWSSSDESVATVSDTGLVTSYKEGSCTITATSLDGGYTASCEVTVTAAPPQVSYTALLNDSFKTEGVWNSAASTTGGKFGFWFKESQTAETVESYDLGTNFKVSMQYYVYGNENWNTANYTSLSIGGFEMRVINGAAKCALYKDGAMLGSFDFPEKTAETWTYSIVVNGSTVKMMRNNETIIYAETEVSDVSGTVTLTVGDKGRAAYCTNVTVLKGE